MPTWVPDQAAKETALGPAMESDSGESDTALGEESIATAPVRSVADESAR